LLFSEPVHDGVLLRFKRPIGFVFNFVQLYV